MEKGYIYLHHRNCKISNIGEYLEYERIFGVEVKDFFEMNKELIFQQMTEDDKTVFYDKNNKWPESSADLDENISLPCPCNLKIKSDKVTSEIAINATNFQVDEEDYFAFVSDEVQNIFQNEGYKLDNVSKRKVDCQVFGWFKSLHHVGRFDDGNAYSTKKDRSEFAELSRHIISLATSVTSNGGSFTIKLPVINSGASSLLSKYEGGRSTIWSSAGKYNAEYNFGGEVGMDGYYAKSAYSSVDSNYYNWLISSNDLIFISFEKLEMELKRGEKGGQLGGYGDSFDIDSVISEGVYDMIGLVDDVSVVKDAGSATAHVEVTGRDLMKLLIEDGTFFFQQSTSSDPSQVFANEQSYGKQGDIREADYMSGKESNSINRIRNIGGEADMFAYIGSLRLDYILKGVISKLANIEVVPDYVFDSWGDDRTRYLDLIPKEEK